MTQHQPQTTNGRARVLAVVVAYNRADLLRRVLGSLQAQTVGAVDVLVIDNASTDHTPDVIASYGVPSFNPGSNTGGAGGFAWGIELAIALGYDFAYIMDDDAVPHADAVEVLLAAAAGDPDKAFFASVPVDEAGSQHGVAGTPTPSIVFEQQLSVVRRNEIAVSSAAFLGVLLNLRVVGQEALPYTEFFIWCDDVEYTSRVAQKYGASCCPASRITHLSAGMQAITARTSLGWKYFFQVRNQLWLYRWGLRSSGRIARTQALLTATRAVSTEVSVRGPVPSLLLTTIRAVSQGLVRRPSARFPGSLLASDARAQRWLAEHRAAATDGRRELVTR